MLQGLRSFISTVPNLQAAKAWYTDLLGFGPYFDEPFYVGFHVGDHELGLLPTENVEQPVGSIAYWSVPDIEAAYARLLQLGATTHTPIEEVGGGIRLGSVTDPSGNILGVIFSPRHGLPQE